MQRIMERIMAGRLAGKVALITGGASGQGRAAALRFAQEGAKVALSDVNADGGVHILYNNAGIVGANIDGDVTQLTVETWDRILNINLRGIFLCSKYGVPALIQAGGGSVINTASIAGLIGSPFAGHAYTASKGGVIALTRAMAMAYARHQVRVNALCPGGVETPMTAHFKAEASQWQHYIDSHPIGRVGTPEDIVHLAVYLASDESSWVTGSIFTIDGGRTAM